MSVGVGVAVIIALLFLPRLGLAHTPGLSLAELDVDARGQVEARLTFSSAELGPGEDLRAFVVEGLDVSADGERCDAAYRGSSLAEGDGLVLEATYACTPGAAAIVATFYYAGTLPRGHRAVARIVGPPDSHVQAEGVITADHRALALALPDPAGSERGQPGRRARSWRIGLAVMAPSAALLLWLLFGRRRWRERRHEARNARSLPKVE
jgi:hypothetical protein